MTPLDVLAIVGEMLSWIGLGLGLPLLLIGLLTGRARRRPGSEPRQASQVCTALGLVLTIVGAIAFIISWVPVFIG